MSKKVYVVDGSRTPFLKATGKSGAFSAADLAVQAGKPLLNRMPFSPKDIDEVIMGCVIPAADEANIARIISLRLGCGKAVPAHTVQRNCASGMQALGTAYDRIKLGKADLILAGGTETMSRAPLQWNLQMADWFSSFMRAKTPIQKIKLLSSLKPAYLKPVVTLLLGLTDPLLKIGMGHTAEIVAAKYNLTRIMQDEFAVKSHLNASQADFSNEIVPIYDIHGNLYTNDTGIRSDSNMEKISKLKPAFDKHYGTVTSANSSQITDGAAVLILASIDAVKKYKLNVIGEIVDHEWVGVDPEVMGLGPVPAVANLLSNHKLMFDDIKHLELNEAFAAQSLGCIAEWSINYNHLGNLNPNIINPQGGAIAIGHPIGASGARIVLHALKQLNKNDYGIATLCIGGGQGGAMLLKGHQ